MTLQVLAQKHPGQLPHLTQVRRSEDFDPAAEPALFCKQEAVSKLPNEVRA